MRVLISFLLGLNYLGFASSDDVQFNRDIRPILSENCFACHGPDSAHREADVRLDDGSALDESIIAGEPEDSEVYARITTDDEDLLMPPLDSGKSLSEEQIGLIKQWIQQGATYEESWAYQQPQTAKVPAISDDGWERSEIDCFVREKLVSKQMAPSSEADRITLARRLSFDLTGLPPDFDAVEAFVHDPRPDAYERYVDRLLADPAFGERMATYWLDLVRFADTVGYHGDQDHSISPYRDYVIDAFNESLAFDQFTKEQLAGDLISEPSQSQLIATGYNRLLQTSHEGGVQPKEYLAIYAADRIRNFSSVWMGATVGCAQCHDHKFDPFTIEDFYSMVAFFADVDEAQHFKTGTNSLPTRREPEIVVYTAQQQQRIAGLSQRIDAMSKDKGKSDADTLTSLKAELDNLNKSGRRTMITRSVKPREVRVLPRGNWLDDSGKIVMPAIPGFMGDLQVDGSRATRMDLARWLVDNDGAGGLTARVMANRFWYLLFGRGISSSLDDFGGQGEPPTHPELLDHLALQFMESQWDVKRIMREIVCSATYRQNSQANREQIVQDPYNKWLGRQHRGRLPAETIRDSALSVSGLLVSQLGGASVKPYQPAGYYRHLNFPTRRYQHDAGSSQWRRGLYVHWQRQFLHPMMKAFDAPSREECTAQRSISNTPLAALTLLNDPTFIEAARALATQLLRHSSWSDDDRIRHACKTCLSRAPEVAELNVLRALLESNRTRYREDNDASRSLNRVGQFQPADMIASSELAAWTMVARAILNLDETITRN